MEYTITVKYYASGEWTVCHKNEKGTILNLWTGYDLGKYLTTLGRHIESDKWLVDWLAEHSE